MKYSWLFTFDDDSGTHTNTEITEGVLKTDGSASGNWVSDLNSLSSNMTHCELRIKGESIPGTIFYVSIDNGTHWQLVSLNTLKTLSPPGQNLKIKVELNSADTQIDSMVLLYKS